MTEPPQDSASLAARGDRAAIAKLLERHLPRLRAFVRLRAGKLIRDHETSSDLVQSVCHDVLRDAHRFQHGGEQGFRRWLYTTALRKLCDRAEYYRAEKRDVRREQQVEDRSADLIACYASFCTPSRHATAREQVARIERAFDALPDHYRELIVGARVLGLSRTELAEQTGQSPGAVRTMLSRAMAKLAEMLDEGDS